MCWSSIAMFRKQLISMILAWLLAFSACLWFFRSSSVDAEKEYQRLISLGDQAKEERKREEQGNTQQSRYQVAKQILYKKDGLRMESRLSSDQSELVFNSAGGKGEFIEHFKGLFCTMQEQLIDQSKNRNKLEKGFADHGHPKQYVRCMNAREAVYSYKSGLLEADHVQVSHYLIDGHKLPLNIDAQSSLMKGQATKMRLSLIKEPSMKAEDFQATLFDWGDDPS